jgi:GntR family transcriptional regulator
MRSENVTPTSEAPNLDLHVNDNTPDPKYYQLYAQIKKQIEEGHLRAGHQLPSERQLAAQLGLNRNTVRKAIQDLVTEGVCTRQLGIGIFVADKRIRMDMQTSMGLTRRVERLGSHLKTMVLEKAVVREPEIAYEALETSEEDELLLLRRLRVVDEEPVVLETAYLSLNRFPKLDEYDLTGSLYRILRTDFSTQPSHAKGLLRYRLADYDLARALNTSINAALFEKEATVYGSDDRPLEYVHGLYRGDRVEFSYYVGSFDHDHR